MTFYEAAVEVLRVAGRPLHYKKITEIAIKRGLLSHIGKTPELTMGSRLNQVVRKDFNDNAVRRTRPGVFTLRVWTEGEGKAPSRVAETTGTARAIREGVEPPMFPPKPVVVFKTKPPEAPPAQETPTPTPTPTVQALPVLEDEPSLDFEEGDSSSGSFREASERRRRRRRRRRPELAGEISSEDLAMDEAPSVHELAPVVAPAVEPVPVVVAVPVMTPDRQRNTPAPASTPIALLAPPQETDREPPMGLSSITQAAWRVLMRNPAQSLTEAELGEVVFGQRMVRFHTLNREAAIRAALVTDNHQRSKAHQRPLFRRLGTQHWTLSSKSLSNNAKSRECQMKRMAADQQLETEAELGALLLRLNRAGLEHLTLMLLERLGYRDLKVSKRLGDGGVVFTGRMTEGLSESRVAVCLTGSERPLTDNHVSSLRGTLHHYAASEGVMIALGDITREARDESRAPNVAQVTVLSREHFVNLLSEAKVGVQTHVVPVSYVDVTFFEDLGLVD